MDDKLQGAFQLGGEHHRSHGRLKIRKWPSSKCNTAADANYYCRQKHLLQSFLEYGSYFKQEKEISGRAVMKQPLIIHTVDPEIVMAEPGEFTSVVQRLTGSRDTRMALRNMKRRKLIKGPASSKNTQKCTALGASSESPILGCSTRLKQQPPSDVSDTDVHPFSSSPAMPLCPSRSGLTTSCSEGYHTDISTESYDSHEPSVPASCGAPSPSNSCRADLQEQVGDVFNDEEDGSSFFLFSLDCYYGNHAA